MSSTFDLVIRTDAPREELRATWSRQRATAREFCRRFANGDDAQLLADDVGMGKTYVALAALAETVLGRQERALLITPSSPVLRAKWEREIRSFSAHYLEKGSGELRPLIVRDFWDLLANLHDHSDRTVERIRSSTLQCLLLALRDHAQQQGWLNGKHAPWQGMVGFDWSNETAMRFRSEFSLAAWNAYLVRHNAKSNGAVRRLATQTLRDPVHHDAGCVELKQWFKDFAARQNSLEPNVLILSMGAIGRRPRSDSENRRQFAIYVLACLLSGRWSTTCQAMLKALAKVNGLIGRVKESELKALGATQLYNAAGCVDRALAGDEALGHQWQQILADPKAHTDRQIQNFFTALLDRVVLEKVRESGIRLAVVDEAHNWKSGANGAARFQELLAPGIACKLLMSATPFQLEEGEMRAVFSYAMSEGGRTAAVLDELYAGGETSLVSRCLAASKGFEQRLEKLGSHDLAALASLSPVDGLTLQRCADDPLTAAPLAALCRAALAYRKALDALAKAQRCIMIRHVKTKTHRSFHAGRDFDTDFFPRRHALYPAEGLWRSEHEFIGYLAMRLDQRLREAFRGESGREAAARLIRGLSSSRSAFDASRSEQRRRLQALKEDDARYVALFDEVLARTPHPKVEATVTRAYANYRQGRKTLIFCERVPTVHEITEALRARIAAHWGVNDDAAATAHRTLSEDALFSEFLLYRSWRHVHNSLSHADPSSPEAEAFVARVLQAGGLAPSDSRVLRLLDLWSFAAPQRTPMNANMGPSTALLRALGERLQGQPDPALIALLLPQVADNASATRTHEAAVDISKLALILDRVVKAQQQPQLWCHGAPDDARPGDLAFDKALWTLLDDEARRLCPDAAVTLMDGQLATFYDIVRTLNQGLREVALRRDQLRGWLAQVDPAARRDTVLRRMKDGSQGSSVWQRLLRLLRALSRADGSINPGDSSNTERRNLWRSVDLHARGEAEDLLVASIDGAVSAERRVRLCAAFNSPLAPIVLVCTAIGSEGIDLHRECDEVIHHDLPWNPARLEQRIGRVDRVDSLAEQTDDGRVRVGIPFLANDHEAYQYRKVLARSQRFQVLLGRPDFETNVDEEDEASSREGDAVREVCADADAADGAHDAVARVLPSAWLDWFAMDLSLAAYTAAEPCRLGP